MHRLTGVDLLLPVLQDVQRGLEDGTLVSIVAPNLQRPPARVGGHTRHGRDSRQVLADQELDQVEEGDLRVLGAAFGDVDVDPVSRDVLEVRHDDEWTGFLRERRLMLMMV